MQSNIIRQVSRVPRGTGQLGCLECQQTEMLRTEVRGVIHDFNNILEVIVGYSELLLERALENPQVRSEIEEIRKAAWRGTGLTRQLLRAYRKEALEPELLDMNRVLDDSRHFLEGLLSNRVEFRIELGTSLYPVNMTLSQAYQVIMNLLTNARDAMPRGGDLLIQTARLELNGNDLEIRLGIPAGRYTTLAVVDTGQGMDPETKSHIFEPFFTTKEDGKGTGLGLATVSGILKQAGGYASVESTLGRGTTFKIYFPAAGEVIHRNLPEA